MRFFIDISYDGTNYHGWQIQPNAVTIQSQINNAISTILNTEISVVGAGRTDTGVHAKQLIAHFDFEKKFDTQNLIYKMNGFLDNDISVNKIFLVDSSAHARFSALSRTYEYKIAKKKDPFLKQSYQISRTLNLDDMQKACKFLIGENDFTAFAKLHSENYTGICNVFHADWQETSSQLIFTISANRFLRNMVRAIVGTMIEIGDKKLCHSDIKNIISSKNRKNAGFSVPAVGLSLISVEYPNDIANEGK